MWEELEENLNSEMTVSSQFNSLRDSISFFDKKGELIRLSRKVNPEFELAALIQNIIESTNKAVCFENIEGFDGVIVSNLCGSYQRMAHILSCDPSSIAST